MISGHKILLRFSEAASQIPTRMNSLWAMLAIWPFKLEDLLMALGLIKTKKSKYMKYKSQLDQFFCDQDSIILVQFILYLNTLMTGWMHFSPGAVPDQCWDEAPGKISPQPSPDHKRGFSIEVETAEQGLMVWCGTGYGQCAALEEIFTQISALESQYSGKLPVVEYTGSEVKKFGKGSTRLPKFKIIDWVDPEFLPWKLQTEANDTPF